jgi:DNA ligase (NAD+)
MGDKSAENLVNAIAASKERALPAVISGLGILHVGGETAELLARSFGSVDALMVATEEQLVAISGIGPIVAKGIVDHFRNEGNRQIVAELRQAGLVLEADVTASLDRPQPFAGMRFVVTGRLEGFTRSEAEGFIKERGGQVTGSVSKKTDYVVVGEEPGSKADDAQTLGIQTLVEQELRELAEATE